jgi:general secretion pathway protein D
VARIQDGVTAVVAGVNQDTKGSSRSGLPVVGMLPLVGRLFATPRQESRQTDVIITVTPHIVRSAGITAEDYLAHIGPPAQGGMNQSIEDVINRAQVEEEQEQRIIAEQQSPGGAPNQQLAPVPGAPAQNTQAANFNNQQRQNVLFRKRRRPDSAASSGKLERFEFEPVRRSGTGFCFGAL